MNHTTADAVSAIADHDAVARSLFKHECKIFGAHNAFGCSVGVFVAHNPACSATGDFCFFGRIDERRVISRVFDIGGYALGCADAVNDAV